MKILLLAGTGAMGSHLADILSERGDKVVITSRSDRESKGQIEYRKGDAKNINFLNAVLEELWDVIIDFMVYTEDEFKKRVEIFLSLASQYIFLSSARVYNESQKPLTEKSVRLLDSSTDHDFLKTNEYSLSKARQENILLLADKKNWTIVRPYITYSESRFQLGTLEKENWLYRALQGRTIVFSEDMKNHFTTLTYGLDVATAIASLINNPISYGEIFHITQKSACKWSDILNIYLDVLEDELGKRPKVVYQDLHDYLSWTPAKYQVIYDRLFDRIFDNTKIDKVINIKEFLSVEVGLEKCLRSFLENPEFKAINWKLEAIKDRYTTERTPLKEISGVKQKMKYIINRYFDL